MLLKALTNEKDEDCLCLLIRIFEAFPSLKKMSSVYRPVYSSEAGGKYPESSTVFALKPGLAQFW
jgi:hypothetical protein